MAVSHCDAGINANRNIIDSSGTNLAESVTSHRCIICLDEQPRPQNINRSRSVIKVCECKYFVHPSCFKKTIVNGKYKCLMCHKPIKLLGRLRGPSMYPNMHSTHVRTRHDILPQPHSIIIVHPSPTINIEYGNRNLYQQQMQEYMQQRLDAPRGPHRQPQPEHIMCCGMTEYEIKNRIMLVFMILFIVGLILIFTLME
jgi:hypothetical protein